MTERWWLVLGIALILVLGSRARLQQAPHAPAMRDPATAETWMIDALPGVGGKRLTQSLEAVRREDFASLQKPARACAEKVFSPGPVDDDQMTQPDAPVRDNSARPE